MIKVHLDGVIYQMAPRGGVSRLFTQTTRALLRLRRDVRVLLSLPAGVAAVPALGPGSIRLRYGNYPSLRNAFLLCWRPNIFHSTYYTLPHRRREKVVVTVYDFVDARFPELSPNGKGFVDRQRRTIEAADAIIAISETTRLDVIAFTNTPADRITVVYPGLADDFQPGPDLEQQGRRFRETVTGGRPYWLFVGLRRNYKNFDTLLQAFCQVGPAYDMRLVLLGGAPKLEAHQVGLLRQCRCEDRIHIVAAADDRCLRSAYAGATAFVQCSLWEGFGIPLVEAAACGAPLVVSEIPVFREIVGEAAWYATPRDPHAWIKALESSLSETDNRRLRVESRARISGRFSWIAAAHRVAAVYERLAG